MVGTQPKIKPSTAGQWGCSFLLIPIQASMKLKMLATDPIAIPTIGPREPISEEAANIRPIKSAAHHAISDRDPNTAHRLGASLLIS
jgi:hypothetical protein